MLFAPHGLATGIGSLPYTDPDEALSLLKKYLPVIPHWPQLPGRGKDEHFVHQFLYPLVRTGLLVEEGDRVYFDTAAPAWPERLTEFYTLYLAVEAGEQEALAGFALPEGAAAGFYAFLADLQQGTGVARYLKGQLAGPLTIAFNLKDEAGRPAYYREQLRDLIVKTLALNAAWQATMLGRFGLPALVFIDDPAISVYGQSSFITVTREMIKEDLSFISRAIHAAGGLAGVHSCDAVDWSILFESELDVVSFDAYYYFNSLIPFVAPLKDYLRRGGVLAWGVVPTTDEALKEDEKSLLSRLEKEWEQLISRGVERSALAGQCLITPACGTGLLKPALAERIYQLTAAVSSALRDR